MNRITRALVVAFFLSSCAAPSDVVVVPELTPNEVAPEELEAAKAHIELLEAEIRETRKQMGVLQNDLDMERARSSELQRELEEMRSQSSSAPLIIQELQDELDRSRAQQQNNEEQIRLHNNLTQRMEEELSGLRSEAVALSQQYQNALFMGDLSGLDPESTAADAQVEDPNSNAPILKKVYYATNRVRLDRDLTDYVRPFILPAVLLAVMMVLLLVNRRYIKEEYQARATLFLKIVGGTAAVVATGMAIQTALQMRQNDSNLLIQYGNELRTAVAGESPYERGWVEVSIPPKRQVGEVSTPNLVKFEFVIDPTKHFQIASVRPITTDRFYSDLQETVAGDPDKSALVFVHGFQNTFQDAAFRTAQIAHDMDFSGAPMFFSWPSQGAVLDYLTDAKNVETTALHLRMFLQEVHDRSGANRIHLIAHSMGSRALSQAVEDLRNTMDNTERFGELVFAAPDIAKDLLSQKVKNLDQVVDGVTLYASAHDSALSLSRALQGGDENNYQRAGETHPRPMVAPPMQTVDVSQATRGHSYISDSPAVIEDLKGLFSGTRELDQDSDNYVPVNDSQGYWLLLND